MTWKNLVLQQYSIATDADVDGNAHSIIIDYILSCSFSRDQAKAFIFLQTPLLSSKQKKKHLLLFLTRSVEKDREIKTEARLI
jgi:hypothetical protein